MQLGSKHIRFAVALAAMVLLCTIGYGMEEGIPYRYSLDTIKTKIENLSATPADTTGRALQAADTDSTDTLVNNSSLEEPIFSGGRDSIVKDFDVDGRKMIYYYGDVKVSYGDLELSADYMAFDVDSKTVFAKGLPDTSGQVIGKPVMKQGEKQYEMESVYYNFNTEKAKIKNMITQEAEGFLHGTYIKKMPDNSINIAKGKYTTCDHEHPHFYLKMTTAKVINGGEKTVFGPSYVVLEDVPTPFALPFGFVPKFGGRASGLLMPTYGEEAARGFFMRGLGYYFVFGDHFDVAATGDIYSMGSWAGQLNARYNKRYKYNGTLSIAYQNDQSGEKGQPDFFQTKNFSLQWSHAMDQKARPGTTFRASVNFSSPSYNKYNNQTDIQTALQNQISSSISFGKTWAGTPFSLTVNALHSQNSRDSSYAVTLPNLTFTVNRIYPFKRKERVGKEKFYESFAFNYSTTLENKINFKASEFGEPDFFKKMKNGMRHNFSISLPSFTLAKYIQGSPSISYGMNWYFTDCEKVFNQETQKVETIYSDPLSTFGISQNFSAGLSLSTRLYGKFVFGKNKRVEAIRHMVTPSISFSAQPEMGTAANGYTQMSYVDANGIQHVVNYNKYEGQINSPPGRGKSAAMSFSLGNNVEAKIRDKNDTTGTGTKKVKIIDQLAIGGSYNFLADSLNLSNISVNMNTTIFGKLGLNVNATLDPYAVNYKGQKINTFNIVQEGGFKLARLTNASASFSYSFSGEGKGRLGSDYKDPNARGGSYNNNTNTSSSTGGSSYQRVYYNPMTGEYIPGGWVYYMSPNVPWSVNMNFNYSYSLNYQYANEQLLKKNNHMMTVGLAGQLRLTDALNVSVNTGIDMMKMKLTTTQLNATYDLHCFAISVSWVPNGQWESWSFRINAKASALADLLQFKKNASYWDNGLR
ncbi:MAG: LPS-assembly protein LptD [Bacteroidales bacterium]|nr:LPS-assembly protein LptD [Bacteroidales bacterium]